MELYRCESKCNFDDLDQNKNVNEKGLIYLIYKDTVVCLAKNVYVIDHVSDLFVFY